MGSSIESGWLDRFSWHWLAPRYARIKVLIVGGAGTPEPRLGRGDRSLEKGTSNDYNVITTSEFQHTSYF